MMYSTLKTAVFGLLVGVLLSGGYAVDAQAQSSRTLTIRDGTVFIDGQRVDEDALPPTLEVEGMNAQYSFSGIRRPVVELNGALYAIGDSLEPVHASEVQRQGSLVFFRENQRGASMSSAGAEEGATAVSDQMQDQPNIQQQYIEELRRRNHQLYDRLIRERKMEYETQALAQRIQQLPEGDRRSDMLDSLRATLNNIFDLKQENRRREVEQLQVRLEELQRRLEKREEMRDEMIDQRIRQLVGETPPE